MHRPFEAQFLKIGERIRLLRESRGYTMGIAHEIRDKYGVRVDPSYLSRIERGKAEIPLRTLIALAHFFNVPLSTFIEPEEPAENVAFLFKDPEILADILELIERAGKNSVQLSIKHALKGFLEIQPTARWKSQVASRENDYENS